MDGGTDPGMRLAHLLADRETTHRALGTYLYPLRIFGSAGKKPAHAYGVTEVIGRTSADDQLLLVTRGAGLFLPLAPEIAPPTPVGPLDITQWNLKRTFQTQATDVFNRPRPRAWCTS